MTRKRICLFLTLFDYFIAEQGDVSKTVKENLSKSVDILEEELDARWFCEYLESRTDEPCVDILKVIQSSNSRTARTKPFVRFLCGEEDIKWFMEALDEYSPHLLDILTQSKDDKKLHGMWKINNLGFLCDFQ